MTTGRVIVVGLGPGDRSLLTPKAAEALAAAEVVVGYSGYLDGIADLVAGKESLAFPLGDEVLRAQVALERAAAGRTVCVVSSGDPGVYAMAGLVLELLESKAEMDVTIVPGVSAIHAAAARLGAPLAHDFAVVSLSDLMTPWPAIERRLRAAAAGDFVVALLNPKSRRRDWQLARARDLLREHRSPQTPVGIVRNAFRPGESVTLSTLAELGDVEVDMFTTVIVGNSRTRRVGDFLVTPRGYLDEPNERAGNDRGTVAFAAGSDILAESFRIIEAEVGRHRFGVEEWPIVRRMIHAAGDPSILESVVFRNDAARLGGIAVAQRTPIVTDVNMVAAGLNKDAIRSLGIDVRCRIDDVAAEAGSTRSYRAMKRAIAELPEAIFVVGNAPTALVALVEAIRGGSARPRVVVAMPVGFVGVVESKESMLALDVPTIALRGRRGGSAMAAAAVNALLLGDLP
jgi:cobalt-factor III methyltransferase